MISVIIPTLNEVLALPHTLACFALQSAVHEVIVSDGGSSDSTAAVAQSAGVQWVTSVRGRGAQMNAGERLAKGEWLLFLHADTLLPAGALATIAALPNTVEYGCFRQAFSGKHPLLRGISWLHNWRCKRTKIIYGDQALFVRRSLFEALGGFSEYELEDVKLSERLLERSTPLLLPATVITDARKFLKQGVIRSFSRMALILICHRYRLPLAGRRFFEAVR